MKRSILLLTFIVFSLSTTIAVPDSVVTGPYNISFDIGLNHSDYITNVTSPLETETLGGDKETGYSIGIRHKKSYYSGLYRMAIITVLYEQKAIPLINGSDWDYVLKSYKDNPSIFGFSSSARNIDGTSGAVALMNQKMDDDSVIRYYQAFYQPLFDPTHTVVNIFSTYQWDEGTLQLLKTIHVEKI